MKSKINNKYVCAVLDEDSRLVARSDKTGIMEVSYMLTEILSGSGKHL